ncbi:aromatic hydrocarbon degradation protein [Photobacterium kishitanii]|uniref:Aromatic hydrocarbon degradation protein n=1 Tax=Photobacterium kishitanii TaxID=318456 RepID=A0AAX0Z0I1_9GAMM|nr:outer membrane protein transport protein [Photobacterium kishitanii]KJG58756.1 aromatic hydrocarbon degradation protein [Photobacterium kishitanii]KJG62789.1 aromatic hydrocarbon degradation protein [Photobacterium kishitanii]KJG66615.1 aromatic hydrocarbon degradation protein [Photobacterium kishitanii]KJG71027.1 aromatic hydrocarbon degradation protein [Photobacterium kishitanii]PSW63238.1 aromatic hydrocarbon degradation protein [Photobacterium kishitanii]
MNKKQIFTRSVITVAIAVASSQTMAAGFQLNAQSATGLGRAFSGDGVIADNASTMAKNAASMTLFDAPALSLGLIAINTDVHVKNTQYNNRPIDDTSIGGTSYAPNIYYIQPINDKFSVGASLYSNFGTKTEFKDGYKADLFGGLTDVKSVNLGLSAAYRINQHFSVGGGLDVIYGSGKLQRGALPNGKNLIDIDADGVALGYNLGTIYEYNQNNRFGLSYRYSPTIEAKGDIHAPLDFSNQKLNIPLPSMLEFSGFNKLNDKFAVHYSIQWIEWSAFDQLSTTGGSFSKDYQWQNSWHYSLGGTYYLNNDWTLRAGYMHDTSAQGNLTSISVPDSDRNWLSGGFTYHLDSKSTIDFGLTYLIGKDVNVSEKQQLAPGISPSITATTRANAWLYGLQYSRSF